MECANLNSTANLDATAPTRPRCIESGAHHMVRSMKEHISQALSSRARIARVIVALAFVGTYTAACDVHGISDPGTLSTLSISPNPQTLAVNATQQFTATGKDFAGADIAIAPVVWTVVA